MRKFKYVLIFILMVLLPLKVNAAGSIYPSTSSLSMNRGGSQSFTITANNAAGRVDIYSSNGSVAVISSASVFLDNNSETITVTGLNAGTATITVKVADAATYDEEVLTNTYSINVTVSDPKPAQNPQPQQNNNNQQTPVQTDNRSSNTSISSLKIEGYDLKKIDDNNYELSVGNNVTSVNITAKAEDEKASVDGTGKTDLEVGLNKKEIVVTAENGLTNTIVINITRKDGYELSDLADALKDKDNDEVNIKLSSDSIIKKDMINEIKKAKKIVNLNYYSEDNKLLYSWTINGSRISDSEEFNSDVEFNSKNAELIAEASNYAEGKYIHFAHDGKLPNGTKIKLYVGDLFKDKSFVNVYYYNSKTKELESIKNDVMVKDGYIEYDIEHCSDYFITRSTITNNTKVKITKNNNLFILISIIELIIIIVLILINYLNIIPNNKK